MSGVFPPAVLHPGFQHVALACYLYLGRCFQLYNAFIFVSFFSFLSFSHAGMNGKHACIGLMPLGMGLPAKFFLHNQPAQSSAAETSTEENVSTSENVSQLLRF